MSASADTRFDSLPPLMRDRAFWGMTATQFFGAFNDNLYKQLILLWCLDVGAKDVDRYQPLAMMVFSAPFLLFSGYAGYLADRYQKRQIVVLCKIAEIGIMLLGMLAFAVGSFPFVFAVLFCMGTHSAFFGPPKYGVLPELIREKDLPQANGIFQLTTFTAIIFGVALAGGLKEWLQGELWMVSGVCVLIACLGTATSLFVRSAPAANPGLPFRWEALVITSESRELLRRDRKLLAVLLLYSLFWFIGGIVQPTVNAVGKYQLQLKEGQTSALAAALGLGIGVGCAASGILARGRVNFQLVKIGAWGMIVMLGLLALPGGAQAAEAVRDRLGLLLGFSGGFCSLIGLGLFSGLFAVPLQVFLQARPPADQKGRMLGAMNLVNWIFIIASAGFYFVFDQLFAALALPRSMMFAAVAVLLLGMALFCLPRDEQNSGERQV